MYVEGRLQTRSWDDKQTGEKRYRTEIVCDNFQMLGQRGDSYSPGPSGPPETAYGAGGGQQTSQVADGPDDDDIPF